MYTDIPIAMAVGSIVAGQGGTLHDSNHAEPLKSWVVAIVDAYGKNLYEVRGENSVPPQSITWDGRANDGRYLSFDSRWRRSTSFIKQDGNSSYGFGYVRMELPEENSQAWENSYQSEIPTTRLSSAIGGQISIVTPHTYSASIAWRVVVRSLDGVYEYSRQWQSFEEQVITRDVFVVDWNGKTNDGVVFPDGEYEIAFESTFYDSILPPYERVDRGMVIIGQPEVEEGETEPEPDPGEAPEVGSPDLCAEMNPVLLIHGLNSYPSMWTEDDRNYVRLLTDHGYPSEYIGLYEYSGQGSGRNGYNNQGGVVEVARGMQQAVSELSQRSAGCGGEGEVDIVAHSMGGLIARQYLAEYPSGNHIDKVITVGTPYQGSWLLEWRKNTSLNGALFGVDNLVDFILSNSELQVFDADQDAYVDLTPESDILRALSRNVNSANRTYALYGDISASYKLGLFNFTIQSEKVDLGDLIVSKQSATDPGRINLTGKLGFGGEESVFVLSLDIYSRLTPVYQLTHEGVHSLRFIHTEILAQKEVKNSVLNLLGGVM